MTASNAPRRSVSTDVGSRAVDDQLKQIAWEWQAMDGAITKAPLGGDATGPNPTDRAKSGTKRCLLTDGRGVRR